MWMLLHDENTQDNMPTIVYSNFILPVNPNCYMIDNELSAKVVTAEHALKTRPDIPKIECVFLSCLGDHTWLST